MKPCRRPYSDKDSGEGRKGEKKGKGKIQNKCYKGRKFQDRPRKAIRRRAGVKQKNLTERRKLCHWWRSDMGKGGKSVAAGARWDWEGAGWEPGSEDESSNNWYPVMGATLIAREFRTRENPVSQASG